MNATTAASEPLAFQVVGLVHFSLTAGIWTEEILAVGLTEEEACQVRQDALKGSRYLEAWVAEDKDALEHTLTVCLRPEGQVLASKA